MATVDYSARLAYNINTANYKLKVGAAAPLSLDLNSGGTLYVGSDLSLDSGYADPVFSLTQTYQNAGTLFPGDMTLTVSDSSGDLIIDGTDYGHSLSITDTAANIQSDLAALTYQADTAGSDTVTITLTDILGQTATGTIAVQSQAVPPPPPPPPPPVTSTDTSSDSTYAARLTYDISTGKYKLKVGAAAPLSLSVASGGTVSPGSDLSLGSSYSDPVMSLTQTYQNAGTLFPGNMTLTATDSSGDLVIGGFNYGHSATITDSAANIQNDLASLSYYATDTGTDSVTISVSDILGQIATGTIAVDVQQGAVTSGSTSTGTTTTTSSNVGNTGTVANTGTVSNTGTVGNTGTSTSDPTNPGTVANTGTTTSPIVSGTTITVNPGDDLKAIIQAAADGDTIIIDAGTYITGDIMITQDVTIIGNGAVHIEGSTTYVGGGNVAKGLFVIGNDYSTPNVTVENLDFSGAHAGSGNGAGIRYQSGNLTLIDDSFEHNQNGVLATPFVEDTGSVFIQGSTFDLNGANDGQEHNIYIGPVSSFTLEDSVSLDSLVGHDVKSRALNSVIENNVLGDTATGTSSYAIDLPDGGNALIQGNTITKGADSSANIMIHIGGNEQQNGGTIAITGNTLIDNYKNPSQAVAVNNQTTDPNVVIQGNTMVGSTTGAILQGYGTIESSTAPAIVQTVYGNTQTQYTSYAEVSDDQTFTFTKSNWVVVGGAGHLTVTNALAQDSIVGGSGGVTTNGGGVVITEAGATDTLNVDGTDMIYSYGDDTINVANMDQTHADIYGTTNITIDNAINHGTNFFYVNGVANINAVQGYDENYRANLGATVNVTTADSTAVKADGFDGEGGTFNFTSPTHVGSMTGYFSGGGDNAATMNITTWGESGLPTAANPISQLTLTQGDYKISAVGNTTIDASQDSGTVTITAYGSPSLSFIGGSGSASVWTSTGAAHVTMGTGTISAGGTKTGAGAVYEADTGGTGTMTISDFRAGTDQLALGQGVTIASETYSGGALDVVLSNHGQFVLTGVKTLSAASVSVL